MNTEQPSLAEARKAWGNSHNNQVSDRVQHAKLHAEAIVFLQMARSMCEKEAQVYTGKGLARFAYLNRAAQTEIENLKQRDGFEESIAEALKSLAVATRPSMLQVLTEGDQMMGRLHFQSVAGKIAASIAAFDKKAAELFGCARPPEDFSIIGAVKPSASSSATAPKTKLEFIRSRARDEQGREVISDAEWEFEAKREIALRAIRQSVVTHGTALSREQLDIIYPIRNNPEILAAMERIQKNSTVVHEPPVRRRTVMS